MVECSKRRTGSGLRMDISCATGASVYGGTYASPGARGVEPILDGNVLPFTIQPYPQTEVTGSDVRSARSRRKAESSLTCARDASGTAGARERARRKSRLADSPHSDPNPQNHPLPSSPSLFPFPLPLPPSAFRLPAPTSFGHSSIEPYRNQSGLQI